MAPVSRFELDPIPASVGRGRAAVRSDATLADLPDATRNDVTLILSELVSNAIAASTGTDPVVVEISREGSSVTLVVQNTGTRMIIGDDLFALPAPEEPRGRGLSIVHRLARRVEVTSSADSTIVRAIIDVASGEDPAV